MFVIGDWGFMFQVTFMESVGWTSQEHNTWIAILAVTYLLIALLSPGLRHFDYSSTMF